MVVGMRVVHGSAAASTMRPSEDHSASPDGSIFAPGSEAALTATMLWPGTGYFLEGFHVEIEHRCYV